MCSVIEIKNANEYYIRYHGPDSMQNQLQHNDESQTKKRRFMAADETNSDNMSGHQVIFSHTLLVLFYNFQISI